MKKVLYLIVGCALAFASCTKFDLDDNNSAITKENAENILGIIDPNQDWSNVTTGNVTVTANANLNDITKVMILTESPFFNDQAKVLAEANVTKGETKTLFFDAPRWQKRLIAACADDNGHFFIKGFNLGDSEVSFVSSASNARTRGVAKAEMESPNLSNISANFKQSYNASRTISANKSSNYPAWKNTNWENDRLWEPTGSLSGSWTLNAGTIYTNAEPITEEEKAELTDIFNSSLFRDAKNNKKRDNLQLIRNGNAVKFFNNHIVSDGTNPITIVPVQLASTEAYMCDLYYYYYNPDDVPSDISLTEYIKRLPKFKAADFDVERAAFGGITGIAKDKNDLEFMKVHEYLLPYYGDPSIFMQNETPLSDLGYTTDGKVYRIKNSEHGMCMTYTTTSVISMKDPYADNANNINDQLWQIYRNSEGYIMFYNVGIGKFMKFFTNKKPTFDIPASENDFSNFLYKTADKDNNPTDATENIHLFSYSGTHILKSNASTDVAIEAKNWTDRVTIQWTFVEYGPASTEATVPFWSLPALNPSPVIAKGYRIGFMLRKSKNENNLGDNTNGCLYSYGELNTEINTFGSFNQAVKNYSMQLNDPRIAMFNANCKTYLTFEDGTDCNFSDIIIEIGGYSEKGLSFRSEDPNIKLASEERVFAETANVKGSGVYMFDEVKEEKYRGLPFTMCFEDRPQEADYDMNDVVLRAIRISSNQIQLSIVAAGANDRVLVCGIPGKFVSGTDLNDKEVHEVFGKGDATGNDRFINTLPGQTDTDQATGTYEVSESMSITQFLSQIYIKNMSLGGSEVHVPLAGEPPYALIIPDDFDYPREGVCMTDAYGSFRNWANNASQYDEWLLYREKSKIIDNPSKPNE
jgi:hypothetical protein